MGKLIYADAFDNYVKKFSTWKDPSDPSYRSIVLTADGYLATHGKKYALTAVSEEGGTSALTLSLLNNKTISLVGAGVDTTLTLPVYDIKGVENNPVTVSGTGEFTIQHSVAPTATTDNSYGSVSGYTINVPKIYVDSFGHVSTASTTSQVVTNYVYQTAGATTAKAPILVSNVTTNGTRGVYFNANIYANLSTGAIYANEFVENGTSLNNKYILKTAIGNNGEYKASNSYWGIVKVSDTYTDASTSNLNAANSVAATPVAVENAYKAAVTYADTLFGAHSDAMVFMGTIKADGTITSYNTKVAANSKLTITANTTKITALTKHVVGWTWKFSDVGTFTFGDFTQKVEIGDMLVCITAGTNTSTAVYTVIQNNIDGAVTASDVLNGIVYSDSNSRSVKSLAFPTSNKILSWNTTNGLVWKDDSNSWRGIWVGGVEKITSTTSSKLDFRAGDGLSVNFEEGGLITFTNTSPLSAAKNLTIYNGNDILTTYSPSEVARTFKFTNGLKATFTDPTITVGHSNSVTAKTTKGLYKFSYDSYGHITGSEAVTLNNLTITDGTTSDTYNTSAAKTLKFANGTDVKLSLTSADNVVTVTPSITHKYKAVSYYKTADATSTTSISGNTSSAVSFKPGNNIELSHNGTTLTISSINTWRSVNAYTLTGNTLSTVLQSVGTEALQFGNEFAWSGSEIKLVWTEISGDEITYHT